MLLILTFCAVDDTVGIFSLELQEILKEFLAIPADKIDKSHSKGFFTLCAELHPVLLMQGRDTKLLHKCIQTGNISLLVVCEQIEEADERKHCLHCIIIRVTENGKPVLVFRRLLCGFEQITVYRHSRLL